MQYHLHGAIRGNVWLGVGRGWPEAMAEISYRHRFPNT
jgi:hypothetical protein